MEQKIKMEQKIQINVDENKNYEIYMNPIASGAYGSVFKAKNLRTNEFIACKLVQCKLEKENPKCKQAMNEYYILKDICSVKSNKSHPNIVKLIDGIHQQDGDCIYIFLEYCEDGDLEQFIKKNELTEETILAYFRQIYDGCKYLQSESILHRDLKASNILLHKGLLKICDFGTAIRFDQSKNEGYAGTENWQAPELLMGKEFYSESAEVFSLGQILYFMIYKTTLGLGQTQNQQIQDFYENNLKFDNYAFPPVPIIKETTKQLIRKMLAYEPSKRSKFSDIDKFFQIGNTNNFEAITNQINFEQGLCQFYQSLSNQIINLQQQIPRSIAMRCNFLLLKRKAFHQQLLKEMVSNKNIFQIDQNVWQQFVESQEFMKLKVALVSNAQFAMDQFQAYYNDFTQLNLNQFTIYEQNQIKQEIQQIWYKNGQIQFGKFTEWMNKFQVAFHELLKILFNNIQSGKASISNEIYKNHLIACDNIMLLLTCKKSFSKDSDFNQLLKNQKDASNITMCERLNKRISKFL